MKRMRVCLGWLVGKNIYFVSMCTFNVPRKQEIRTPNPNSEPSTKGPDLFYCVVLLIDFVLLLTSLSSMFSND